MSLIPGVGGGFIFSSVASNVLLDAEFVPNEYGQTAISVTAPAGAAYYDIYAIGPGGTGGNGTNDPYGGVGGRGGDFFAVENLFLQDTTMYFFEYNGTLVITNTNHPFGTQLVYVAGGDAWPSPSGITDGNGGTVLDNFYGGAGGTAAPWNHGGGGGGAANGGGGIGVSGDASAGANSTSGFSGAGGAAGAGIFPAGSGGQGATVNLIGFAGNNYGGGGAGSGRNNSVFPAGAPGWIRIRFKSSMADARLIVPSGIVRSPKGP